MKWLAYLSGVILAGLVISVFLPSRWSSIVGSILIPLLITSIPAGVGIAILRYRLYDIDLLIKRTLVTAP